MRWRADEVTSPAEEWAGRPWLARALRLVLTLLPFTGAVAVSYFVSNAWARPDGWAILGWLISITLLSFTAMVVIDRVSRRVVPLTILLRMTLIFPDKAPSRFSVALRSSSTKELDRTVAEVKADGLGGTADDAAENLLVMIAALTRHDRLTRGHAERTRAYTDLIAEEMGLTKHERSKLRWAALLHDMGKVYVPARILNKPESLTDREFDIVKTHPAHGARMIEPLREWLGEWADTVGQHHERWDGGGYPNGIAGHAICRGARIVAVADTFDVITSIRSYKKAQSSSFARAEIAANSGTQFDPDVVRAFLSVGLGRFRFEMAPLTLLAQLPALRFLLDVGRAAATITTTGAGAAAPAAAAAAAVATGVVVVAPTASTIPDLAFAESEGSTEVEEVTLTNSGATTTIPVPIDPSVSTSTSIVVSLPSLPPTTGPTTTRASTSSSTTTPSSSTTTLATTTTSVANTSSTVTAPPLTTSTTAPPTTAPPTTVSPTTTTTTIADTIPPVGPGWPSGLVALGDCLGEPVDLEAWRDQSELLLGPCVFDGLDFGDLDLSGMDFTGGSWMGADFSNSNLDGTDFFALDLTGAVFDGANLESVAFKSVGLDGASFVDADFVDTLFESFSAVGADFGVTGNGSPVFDDVRFKSGNLTDASFADRQMAILRIETTVGAVRADFSNVQLNSGWFIGVDLTDANFSGLSGTGSDFASALLGGVDFIAADLRGTWFDNATLSETSFLDVTGNLFLDPVNMVGPVTCPSGQVVTSPPATGDVCDN